MLRNDARLKAIMADRGIAALIGTTPQSVRYLTDYESPSLYIHRYHGNLAVAVGEAMPTLITTMAGLEYMVGRGVATDDIRTTGTYHIAVRRGARLSPAEEETLRLRKDCPHYETQGEAVLDILASLPHGSQVAIDEEGIAPEALAALTHQLGAYSVVPGAKLLRQIRAVKSANEIRVLQKACEINERAAQIAWFLSASGASEAEMERVFRAEAARSGADPVHWETTIGPRSSGSYYASDYVGGSGEIIRSDSSVRYRMYWADTGRTRVIGTASTAHQKLFKAILAGQLKLLEKVAAGMRVAELFLIGIEAVRRAGIANYDRHHVGHGIGLEMYEPPILTCDNDQLLESGMVINVELPYYEIGNVGLQIEDTVVVTETGCTVLTDADRDLVGFRL